MLLAESVNLFYDRRTQDYALHTYVVTKHLYLCFSLFFKYTVECMPDSSSLIGTKFESYEIQALIGSGGMASVYRGFDQDLQRPVAIKVLHNQLALVQPELPARFRQEARLIARLRHPHIVQVYDFGEQDGYTFMVEEFLPGPTLGRQLRELAAHDRRLSRDETIMIVRHLASALDAAHAAGIIHRDIKPENAIWNAEGELVLTDFGIARYTLSDVRHTQTGMIIGTPDYLSPEQAQGLSLTSASDVYSLGIVLYRMLAGKVPFSGDTPLRVLMEHINTPPPPLHDLRPDLPSAVEGVVQRALAKDAALRFSSCGELARALEQAWPAPVAAAQTIQLNIHDQATRQWQTPPASQAIPPVLSTPADTPAPAAVLPPARRRGGWLLIGLLLLAFLLGGGALALRGRSGQVAVDPTSTPSPTPALTPSPALEPTARPTDTPTFPPVVGIENPTGQIAFTSNRDGDWEIYVMDADGGNLRNLTNNRADDFAPAWSPDGSQIAFHSNRDGNEEIYVMNANGGNQRNISNATNVSDREPTWSPDGSQIAFWSNPIGTWDIFVMNSDGSNRQRLTTAFADDFAPAWSPDGSQIAFSSNRDGNDEIYIINSDGSNERNLAGSPQNDLLPAWSPDGSQIAFVSERDGNGEIYIMNTDGSNQRNLTNNTTWDTMPYWSPDGRFIVFTANRDDNDEIYVIDADGSNPRRITSDPAADWDATWVDGG